MYTVRKSQAGSVFYDIYFVLVAMLGAFFVLNLMTAVQFRQFDQHSVKKREEKGKKLRKLNNMNN
jgi:hypothetical protein